MTNQFLIKETMADMKTLSTTEIDALETGTYDGVQLLGYYQKGDTPAPIIYYYVNPLTDPDPGSDNGGNIIVAGSIKLFYPLSSEVNVKCFGAKGDGVTDDTQAIQRCLNTLVNTVYFPTPAVGYKVSTIRPNERQTLKGDCKYSQAVNNVNRGIIGDGINTTIIIGNGITANEQFIAPRISYVELQDLIVTNIGAGCIRVDGCINWRIFNCRIRSTGDGVRTIDANYSWRGIIADGYIDASGTDSWAISCLNQMNGVQIHRNVVTGGLQGGAIVFGRGQGASIRWNTIEYCQKGIFVASTSDSTRDGGVNGLEVDNNYIERVGAPICLAKNFGVNGASVSNNYLVHNGDDVTPSDGIKYGMITWGRMRNSTVENNTLWSNNMIMYVWHLPVEDSLQCVDNRIDNNYENMTDTATLFSLAGTYSSNGGYLRAMAGRNYFSFFKKYEDKGIQSSNELREWISPLYKANEIVAIHQWLDMDLMKFGGSIYHIQIIDKLGDVSGCGLRIGNGNNANAVVANLDIGTLTYRSGIATVKNTVSSASIFADVANTIGITPATSPTSTGTFRVKILYRAT